MIALLTQKLKFAEARVEIMVTKVRLSTNLSKVNGVSSAIVVTTVTVGKMANAMEVTVVTDKTEREMTTMLKDIRAETMKTNVTAKTIVTNK